MTKKELLYKQFGALRLEVDSSIVDEIVATANEAFKEQFIAQHLPIEQGGAFMPISKIQHVWEAYNNYCLEVEAENVGPVSFPHWFEQNWHTLPFITRKQSSND